MVHWPDGLPGLGWADSDRQAAPGAPGLYQV